VAFKQLYYTSCEHGLSGYSGFQFTAVTRDVSPVVMREVEDRTVYEPPGRLRAGSRLEMTGEYPVAFCYGTSDATGDVITAQVVFAGTDYSGRPGNYFAHALVTATPSEDFGPLFPVELWRAALWREKPDGRTELPELTGPLPRGTVDRSGTEAFLSAHDAAGVLPRLVTAVGKAMAGDRPVLLASHDAGDGIWWIAAVSYLLGEQAARRMTFTTYTHRPAHTRYHLTGVLPEALPPDAGRNFQLFDLTTGQAPGGSVHPLAAILADTGVAGTAQLWRQAAEFGLGTEAGLDDWLGPVTAAAGLLGRPLSQGETDQVAGWLLTAARSMPQRIAEVALGIPLNQPEGRLSDRRLADLHALAQALPVPGLIPRMERVLAGRSLARLAQGQWAPPVELTGPAAEEARAEAIRLLRAAAPATALAVLQWAAGSGLSLPDVELEEYGRTRLDPLAQGPELARLLRQSPAVRRGLLDRLASEPPAVAEVLLANPAGPAFERGDLAAYPGLTELWLIQAAAHGAVGPLRAFDEICDIRAQAGRSPLIDRELLDRLWPRGCPPEQFAELLQAVTEPPAADVLAWLTAEVSAAVARGAPDGGLPWLARALDGHPLLPLLPETDQRALQEAAHVERVVERARTAVRDGEVTAFAELFGAYAATDDDGRRLLRRELSALLAQADPLVEALRGCPWEVAHAFCRDLTDWLSPMPADTGLARRVFAALVHPDVTRYPALVEQLRAPFERVRGWHRRDLAALARALEPDGLGPAFRAWRGEQQARRGRGFFGGERRGR
jgi:GTPase-associated protein 1, N-terminal domain type 2/GTPase-associated protein 1, C-terminal domain/GTPase-associated protein 1, middle domain